MDIIEFFERNQNAEESFDEWYLELKEIAQNVELGKLSEDDLG